VDRTGFFTYPGEPLPAAERALLADWGDADWAVLLAATETRRFQPGETVLREGERDPALYLLVDGRLAGPRGVVDAISTVGEAAFFDGRPRAATVTAISDGELLRLGRDAFDALAAREPVLARAFLFEVGAVLAARVRDDATGWTG
jgi:CRP/FNR family transcriptional regulator, cyclic AMP receptor protein